MNKKTEKYLLKIITTVFMLFFAILLCPGKAQASEKKVDAISYKMNLSLDTNKDRLKETVTIRVKNNTSKTVSTLCIRDMTPAIHKFNKKYLSKENENKSSKIKYVRLKGKKKNLKIKYSKDKTAIYVKLGKKGSIKPGEKASVVISMETDVPNRQDRFGVVKTKSGKLFCLSFCFPYLADNENGKWITDPYFDDGESRSYDLANYYVTFCAPSSYKVAATGCSSTKGNRTVIKAKKFRDFAIVACNYMKKDSFTVKGVKVNNYYIKGNNTGVYRKMSSLVAKDSIKLFLEKVGKYPYEELDILPTLFGMGYGGMEYPGLVMINASQFSKSVKYDSWAAWSLMSTVAHEIGHQWFYAAVGNNEYREAWIDEGFTTYLEKEIYGLYDGPSYRYYRKVVEGAGDIDSFKKERDEGIALARELYKGMYLDISPDHYTSERGYGDAEYEGGYFFLEEVRMQMGDSKFGSFLKEFYSKYYMKKTTTKDIIGLIRKYDNSKKMNSVISFYFKNSY